MSVRKGYVDGPYGQIHVRSTEAVDGVTPLVALHATAYSSQSFLPLMDVFDGRRQVIAIDAPGYGESDRPFLPLDMAGYAEAIGMTVAQIDSGLVDLLGYHTGAYVAAELAIRRPDLVRRLILVGVPYFKALGADAWREKLCREHSLGESLSQFAERWDYFVTNRDPRVSRDRGFANFVDELKAWPHGSAAHKAMFDWDADGRLPLVEQPVLILNPEGHLAPASRAAAGLLRNCTVVELPWLNGPVLEIAAAEVAQQIQSWTVTVEQVAEVI